MPFIDYGSSDPSVVFAEPLTSGPGIFTEIGSPGYGSGGAVFGAGEGLALDILNTFGSVDLDAGAQLRFEVPTTVISDLDATYNALGYARGAAEFLCSWGNSATPTEYGRIDCNPANQFRVQPSTVTNQSTRATTFGRDVFPSSGYSEILVSWNTDDTISVYIDRVAEFDSWTYTKLLSLLNYLWLGIDRGTSNSLIGRGIRNVQLSAIQAPLPTKAPIGTYGDSFVTLGSYTSGNGGALDSPRYDLTTSNAIAAGYRFNADIERPINDFGFSGQTVIGELSNPTNIDTLLASNPDIVVTQMGTNDATIGAALNLTEFETDLKFIIDSIMAGDSVRYMIMGNVPTIKANSVYDSAEFVTAVSNINAIYATIPSWWNTNNPGREGRVQVVDVFTAHGGQNPDTSFASPFVGYQGSALQDDLHESSGGMAVRAKLIFDKLREMEATMATFGNANAGNVAQGTAMQPGRAHSQDVDDSNGYTLQMTGDIELNTSRIYAARVAGGDSEVTFRIYACEAFDQGGGNIAYRPTGNSLAVSNPVTVDNPGAADPQFYQATYPANTVIPLSSAGAGNRICMVAQDTGAQNVNVYADQDATPDTPYLSRNNGPTMDPWTHSNVLTENLVMETEYFSVGGGKNDQTGGVGDNTTTPARDNDGNNAITGIGGASSSAIGVSTNQDRLGEILTYPESRDDPNVATNHYFAYIGGGASLADGSPDTEVTHDAEVFTSGAYNGKTVRHVLADANSAPGAVISPSTYVNKTDPPETVESGNGVFGEEP